MKEHPVVFLGGRAGGAKLPSNCYADVNENIRELSEQ